MIEEKLTEALAAQNQSAKFFEARAKMQGLIATMSETMTSVQTIADSGVFDQVDSEIKTAMVEAKGILDDANTAISASVNVQDLMAWRP
jgi:hypothetical protein